MTKARPIGPLSREIGAILRGALARQGKKQVELAEAIGVDQAQVSRLLSGKRVLDVDQVDAACQLLRLDLVRVVAEAEAAVSVTNLSDRRDRTTPVDQPAAARAGELEPEHDDDH